MRPPVKSRRSGKRPTARKAKSGALAIERVARAVQALRRGKPVAITGGARILALAIETASDTALESLGPRKDSRLLLTHARAATLKIRLYTKDVVALPVAADATAQSLRAIADPTEDLGHPLKGPFTAVREQLPVSYASAVKLAKLAGLLPACVVRRSRAKGAVEIAAADIDSYDDEIVRRLTIVMRARVPLKGAETAEMIAFRAGDAGPEHYAILIGHPPTKKPVLTRLHSECFTGDLLGSLRCDCGSQLRGAIAAISKAGGGILLYLAQEGRGIGLINKLRAYRLQDQGFDTMQANERLGFEADERLYGIAAQMLKLLGYRSVRLLTNNPQKVAALKAAGVTVAARVRHAFPENDHNRAYLRTKAEKGGHLL
jgi:GTP cyclohydrolase II